MATLTKRPRHLGESENTYHLPQGEAIRRELVKWFGMQRKAVMTWVKTGEIEVKKQRDEIPGTIPTWDAFKLGALPMSERMTPKLEAIWDSAGQKFTSEIGLDPDSWEVTNPKTQDAIDQAALNFCQATNDTTSMDLDAALAATRDALTQGLIEHGESVHDLTKRINKIFDGAEKWRARRIAASEASRAVHSAQEMQAEESEIVTGWRWLISANSCELCKTVARRAPVVKIGQPFAVVGDNPTYSTVRFPPLHPSCRCTVNAITIYDEQPKWSKTLDQPEPEEEDYKPESLPGLRQPELRKPVAKPKPAARRKPISDEARINAPASPGRPRPGKVNKPITDFIPFEPHVVKIDRDSVNAQALAAPKKAISPVPVALLRVQGDRYGPLQDTINERIVEYYRDNPSKKPIIALWDEGKFWIHSGHHRAAAAVMRDDFSVPGLIFRVKPGTAKDAQLMIMDEATGDMVPFEPEGKA